MTADEKKEALKRWEEHCNRLQRITSKRKPETEAERKKNIARALKDYEYFCQRYLSHYCQCKNARFHNDAARYIEKHPEMRAVFKAARPCQVGAPGCGHPALAKVQRYVARYGSRG